MIYPISLCGGSVTRKIIRAIVRMAIGLRDCLHLGNMSTLRDWGTPMTTWRRGADVAARQSETL